MTTQTITFKKGDKVTHRIYGAGIVCAVYTTGILIIDVRFGGLILTVEISELTRAE